MSKVLPPFPLLKLTEEECIEYDGLPKDVVLTKYIRAHKNDRCPHCQRLVGNHSLKRFNHCVGHEQNLIKVKKNIPQLIQDPPSKKLILE